MRPKLLLPALSLLAACNDTDRTAGANAADTAAPIPWNSAASNLTVDSIKPTAAPEPFEASRLADGPDKYERWDQRGGIAVDLGEVSTPFNEVISGRWAYNCNTGVGPLTFRRDGRFEAPGGSGRYAENGFKVTFTFADGQTETWTYSLSENTLGLERKTGSISRKLCSKTV